VLHITNGQSVSLAEAGMAGEIVYWNDVLHEGPVPCLPLDELSQLRAGFLARAWAEPEEDLRSFFERRDAALKGFRDHDEVVLWFEHDLYDQLQLIQILDYLGGQPRGSTRVSLIQSGTYLGPMEASQLTALFPSRQDVQLAQFTTAQRAWAAFRAPEPAGLTAVVDSDTTPLPYLRAAIRRHLEQFPSTRDGLNRTERQILQAVADGAATIGEAFRAGQEDPLFMGDVPFIGYVRDLSACRKPLLEESQRGQPMDTHLRLTAAGRSVLHARQDNLELNGIDRWLGGVHLIAPDRIWRWNGSRLAR
jgi:hypothetical protein